MSSGAAVGVESLMLRLYSLWCIASATVGVWLRGFESQ